MLGDEGRDRGRWRLTSTSDLAAQRGPQVERGVELRLKNENLEQWIANAIRVPSTLNVKPGIYLVRVVVRDSEGQLMAARNGSVDIP